MKSFLNNHEVRGLRNNNPGNLVKTKINWVGKIVSSDKKFEQFIGLEYGIRAFLKDIVNDINKGKNTVQKLVSEFAPKNENDTDAYIKSVADTIGVSPTDILTKINTSFLVKLSRAFFKVELGHFHTEITDNDIVRGIRAMGNVSTPKLQVDLTDNFFFQN